MRCERGITFCEGCIQGATGVALHSRTHRIRVRVSKDIQVWSKGDRGIMAAEPSDWVLGLQLRRVWLHLIAARNSRPITLVAVAVLITCDCRTHAGIQVGPALTMPSQTVVALRPALIFRLPAFVGQTCSNVTLDAGGVESITKKQLRVAPQQRCPRCQCHAHATDVATHPPSKRPLPTLTTTAAVPRAPRIRVQDDIWGQLAAPG